MKFAAIIEYDGDKGKIAAVFPAHRLYLRGLLDGGRLLAAGPFADDGGALIIYEADRLDQVEDWIQGDPFHAAGLIVGWKIQPLVYWSAKAAGPGKKTADDGEVQS